MLVRVVVGEQLVLCVQGDVKDIPELLDGFTGSAVVTAKLASDNTTAAKTVVTVDELEIAGGGSIGRRDQSVLILIGQSSAGQLLAGRQVGNGIRTWVLSCSSGTRLGLDRTCSGLNAGASLSASSSLRSATRGRTAAGLTVDLERGHRRAHK